jgi:hypothetical protein
MFISLLIAGKSEENTTQNIRITALAFLSLCILMHLLFQDKDKSFSKSQKKRR